MTEMNILTPTHTDLNDEFVEDKDDVDDEIESVDYKSRN